MIAASVSTAPTGYSPIAVSPASMIASAPWSTAVAASLTSARVGRGSVRIDSRTCVATIAGTPRARAARDDRLLDPRHMLERTLEAEIAARDHHAVGRRRGSRRDARAPAGRSIFAISGTSAPGAIGNRSRREDIVRRLHEAERDQVDAELEAESQVLFVLRRHRAGRQPHAGRVDALVLAERAAVDDARHELVAARARHAQLDLAVVEQQPIARARGRNQLGVGREHAARPAGPVAGGEPQLVALVKLDRLTIPQRSDADLRTAEVLKDGDVPPARAAAVADGAVGLRVRFVRAVREVQPEHVDARRRSARRCRSGALLAGPSVAMILVCRVMPTDRPALSECASLRRRRAPR